jgi:hypothetical protein
VQHHRGGHALGVGFLAANVGDGRALDLAEMMWQVTGLVCPNRQKRRTAW